MKNLIFAFLFLFFVSYANAQDWTLYKNIDLEFSATFPEEPTITTQEVPVEEGTSITMHMAMLDLSAETESLNAVYGVAYAEYSKEDFIDSTEESDNVVLNGAVDGARGNVNGELLYSNPITFNRYLGRNAKIAITGAYIHLKIYLVENVIYFCQVICFTNNDENSDIDKFLNSFELIKTKQ